MSKLNYEYEVSDKIILTNLSAENFYQLTDEFEELNGLSFDVTSFIRWAKQKSHYFKFEVIEKYGIAND